MSHPTRSQREWVSRYAAWLTRVAGSELTQQEALLLGQFEYLRAFDASPEGTAAGLILSCDPSAELATAEYSAAILLRKVSARGFRIAQ